MKIVTTAPVRHNGEDIEVGSALDLPDRQAQALLDAQSAELPAKKPKTEKDGDGK